MRAALRQARGISQMMLGRGQLPGLSADCAPGPMRAAPAAASVLPCCLPAAPARAVLASAALRSFSSRGASPALPALTARGEVRFSPFSRVAVAARAYSDAAEASEEMKEVSWDATLANTVSLIGRVGQMKPAFVFDDGTLKVSCTLAVRRGAKDGETDWYTVEFQGLLAEVAERYLSKGLQIAVQGRLVQNAWTSKTGRNYTDVVVHCRWMARVRSKEEEEAAELAEPEGNYADEEEEEEALPAREAQSASASQPYSRHSETSARGSYGQSSGRTWQSGGASSSAGSGASRMSVGPRSAQTSYAGTAGSSSAMDKKQKAAADWESFFENPDDYWDNRENKKSPRAPDFKHKDTADALWIDSYYTPDWVAYKLSQLDARKYQ